MAIFNRRLRRNKSASLELSINAIVILIIAITVLGLGLAFVKGIFGGTVKKLTNIEEDIRDREISELKEQNLRLGFTDEDISIRRAEEQEIYFAIKNEEDSDTTFAMFFDCSQAIGVDDIAGHIEFDYFEESPPIRSGEAEVMKVIVRATPDAQATSYLCTVAIGDNYATKNFYVTIK